MEPRSEVPARTPRAVPAAHVGAWYREALALFRVATGRFVLLAAVTIACEIALGLIPVAGPSLAAMVVPLVASGMYYAALAADEREPVRLRFAVLAFAAPFPAVAAVILSSVIPFAVQVLVAAALGADLLSGGAEDVSAEAIVASYAAAIFTSLPLTFVPFAALFEGAGVRASFAASVAAFLRNAGPLGLYGLVAFVLVLVGFATSGLALVVVLPLLATSSYAAWKDLFGVERPSARPDG